MEERNLLDGKRVLIVDDELDVLDVLQQLLPMCDVSKASDFEKAKKLLEDERFDMAILDIMGVDGYELLRIANEKGIPAVMLTAHALSPDNIVRSFKEGAASYLPKEKMANIATFLNEILEAKRKGKHPWWRWLERWASFYDRKFGAGWQNKHKDFWDIFKYYT
jgi:DNA-binding response OmpR family regulator